MQDVNRHTPEFFRDFSVIFAAKTADFGAGGGRIDGADGTARPAVAASFDAGDEDINRGRVPRPPLPPIHNYCALQLLQLTRNYCAQPNTLQTRLVSLGVPWLLHG